MVDDTSRQIEDEVSLSDVVKFLNESKNAIAASIGSCMVIAIALFFLMPAQYEATATIQMALVANQSIEAPPVLLEKIKLPSYFSQETREKCEANQTTQTLNREIHPTLSKSAPFISFAFQADSIQKAKDCISLVINDVRLRQSELFEPLLAEKQTHLAMLEAKLALKEDVEKLFLTGTLGLNFKDEKFSAASLIWATKLANEQSVKELKREIDGLKIALQPPQTRETHAVTPVYCADRPVNKRPLLFLAISILTGLIGGVLYALGKKAWRT